MFANAICHLSLYESWQLPVSDAIDRALGAAYPIRLAKSINSEHGS